MVARKITFVYLEMNKKKYSHDDAHTEYSEIVRVFFTLNTGKDFFSEILINKLVE